MAEVLDIVARTELPAQDLDAEAAVLSAILLHPPVFEKVRGLLHVAHFYSDSNRRIYEAMLELESAGRPFDEVTVANFLRERHRLDGVGGTLYLFDLATATPAVANVEEHARIVVKCFRRRQLVARAHELATVAQTTDTDVTELARSAVQDISALVDEAAHSDIRLPKLGTLLEPAIARAERRRTGEEKPIPIPFPGWAESLGGGLWPGAHFLVSGTAVGKSQLTIQTALCAAQSGVPTAYVGLELDDVQIALRAVGHEIGVRWSSLYLGRCSEETIARARNAAPAFQDLPFYLDFGPARGWPASRLFALASWLRKAHPSGPLLIVLDYLQLVGQEPATDGRAADVRQRIADAAYMTRDVARRFDAAVVVVSSAARTSYGLLASDAAEAGLITSRLAGFSRPVRTIARPHVLVGLGKESGEVEFSADTVTVLIKWPGRLDNGERAIVVAVPKVRAGIERWSALAFDGGRFAELDVASTDDLPAIPKNRGGRQVVADEDLRERVLETIRRHAPKSKRGIAANTRGTDRKIYQLVDELLDEGIIDKTGDGTFTASKTTRSDQP